MEPSTTETENSKIKPDDYEHYFRTYYITKFDLNIIREYKHPSYGVQQQIAHELAIDLVEEFITTGDFTRTPVEVK